VTVVGSSSGTGSIRSFSFMGSPFITPVIHIILMSAYEQMSRIYTPRSVALVEYLPSLDWLSVSYQIC
jgi:hypothetical protein